MLAKALAINTASCAYWYAVMFIATAMGYEGHDINSWPKLRALVYPAMAVSLGATVTAGCIVTGRGLKYLEQRRRPLESPARRSLPNISWPEGERGPDPGIRPWMNKRHGF